jgi:hypothetical protein
MRLSLCFHTIKFKIKVFAIINRLCYNKFTGSWPGVSDDWCYL